MAGKLSGIGVGPGDSGLLTLKAKKLLDEAAVIAYPVKAYGEESTALNIIKEVVDLRGKDVVEVLFKMDRNLEKREQCRQATAELLAGYLMQNKDVAMITLGDVAVYSTYTYVHQMVRKMGYETEIIPGITSFSSGAALAQVSLVEGNESLCVVSALKGMDALAKTLDLFENVVVMKAGNCMSDVMALLEAKHLTACTMVLSNIGLENAYIGPMDLSRTYGYFTTLIIKKGGL